MSLNPANLTYLAFVHLPRYREIVYGLMRGERRFRRATAKLVPFEPLLRCLETPPNRRGPA